MADVPYQSLYRRYRPQRFEEVRGQDHVTAALRNAVRDGRTTHAYLFSGPRGTGKTSTARILAKALNCTNLEDGEPCGRCDSCVQVQQGASLDVIELDAASNNGVDAMRDLVSRAALGSPGRWKVYIVDEVHMLSTAASNTLLKTLEEPPGHVVFVLATTDPQKVLPTIRSRTQHYEFRLLSGDVLSGLLRDVNAAAGLGVAPDAIDFVARRGAGSARDALSVLDQVAAAGSVHDEDDALGDLVEALCDHDVERALLAIAEAVQSGRDPRRMASDVLERLRDAFLAHMAPGLVAVSEDGMATAQGQAKRLGTAGLVRAMEVLGQAVIDMREALDPRISLDVAIVRIANPATDDSNAALLERVERLERVIATGGATRVEVPAAEPAAAAAPSASAGAKAALGALRKKKEPAPTPAADRPVPAAPPAPAIAPAAPPARSPGRVPDRDALTMAWADEILPKLRPKVKALYGAGRFAAIEDGAARFAVPNEPHRQRCEEVRREVEEALAAHFGVAVPLRVVVEVPLPDDDEDEDEDEDVDPDDLEDAPAAVASPTDRLREAFPGAEEVV